MAEITRSSLMFDFGDCLEMGDDTFQWFVRLNKKYKRLRKEGKINDALMVEFTAFWINIGISMGEDYIEYLAERWNYEMPTLIKDIMAFMPRYNEIRYNTFTEKMDDIEKSEAESLSQAIWDKNVRCEIECEIYDWDADDYKGMKLSIPRKDRDNYLSELKLLCAEMIYNRGTMLIRFYSHRGKFEIAGVKALDGRGRWESLTEYEIKDCYEEGLYSNEKPIVLKHSEIEQQSLEDNVLYLR